MKYANDFAAKDGILRVHFIAHGEQNSKSDAFLTEFDGEYYLIDGGMKGNDSAYRYLMNIRSALLKSAGAEDQGLKLRINWLVSHFHVDHVCGALNYVLPSPDIEVDHIYLPPDSALDPHFHELGTDGDTKYRPILAKQLEEYQPQAVITENGFGTENEYSFAYSKTKDAPVWTVYPPTDDYGVGEMLDYTIKAYYDGDVNAAHIATAVVNAGTDWYLLRYGEKSFLFTGDSMKKVEGIDDESGDRMMRAYGERIGKADVIKYLHHGVLRDPAAKYMIALKPEYIVVTTPEATAEKAVRDICPDTKIKFVNASLESYVFDCNGKSIAEPRVSSY